MSLGIALRARLLADEAVHAKVGTRIYRTLTPPNVTGVRIVYQRISGTPYKVLDGKAGMHRERYQLTCWGPPPPPAGAATGKDAEALATLVKAALADTRGTWSYADGGTTVAYKVHGCRLADVRDLESPPGDAGPQAAEAVQLDFTIDYSGPTITT